MLLTSTVPELAAALHRQWPAERLEQDMQAATNHGIRVIANTITHIAWRNGPIENVHAELSHQFRTLRRKRGKYLVF